MEPYDLDSWAEFRQTVQSIRDRYGLNEALGRPQKNTILFRGVADPPWELKTTLERFTDKEFSIQRYMVFVSACSPEIESFTGKKWNVPDRPEREQLIIEKQSNNHPYLPCYDFLVYLRHHGFPSPLLDWTLSPYIAAYFAYFEQPSADRVAVYAYIEMPEGTKGSIGDEPLLIHVKGPYVTTHSRHFAQKSYYTIATQFDAASQSHIFRQHQLVFDQGNRDQDILIKITLPAADRMQALKELDDYNINHFTLFQTEDALVKALALKEFQLRLV